MSRSRARRRCWKPSSKTINWVSNSSTATRAAAMRSAILQVRYVGQFLLQFPGLVVSAALFGAVTAADYRHPHPAPSIPAGDPFDQGRFAGPAQCQVAHAHHRHAHVENRRLAMIVAPIAPRHGQGVRHFGQAQGAQQRCSRAPPAAANQILPEKRDRRSFLLRAIQSVAYKTTGNCTCCTWHVRKLVFCPKHVKRIKSASSFSSFSLRFRPTAASIVRNARKAGLPEIPFLKEFTPEVDKTVVID